MRAEAINLPSGMTLIAHPKSSGCTGCWFDTALGGCIGFLAYNPGCGSLTRSDAREIVWVQQGAEGTPA